MNITTDTHLHFSPIIEMMDYMIHQTDRETLVEVGVNEGDTLSLLYKRSTLRTIGVDLYPDLDNNQAAIFIEDVVMKNLRDVDPDNIDKVKVVHEDGTDSPTLKSLDDKSISFVHYDASSRYDHVKAFTNQIIPKMKREGIICYDNYTSLHFSLISATLEMVAENKLFPISIHTSIHYASMCKMYFATHEKTAVNIVNHMLNKTNNHKYNQFFLNSYYNGRNFVCFNYGAARYTEEKQRKEYYMNLRKQNKAEVLHRYAALGLTRNYIKSR